MANSNIQVYVHFVWHTKNRAPVLSDDLELFVHNRIREMIEDDDLIPLAINSAWTHTHPLVKWNATTKFGKTIGRWKGCTSREWRQDFDSPVKLKWQVGYGAFSVCPDQVDTMIRYIGRQKHHHRHGTDIRKYERVNFYDDVIFLDDESAA